MASASGSAARLVANHVFILTSHGNLDFRTERSIKCCPCSWKAATLIIAHRPSMLTDVDRVLVLQNGRIEQDGTPDQLIEGRRILDMMCHSDERLTSTV